ncbi:MAG: hypothetical protein SFV21_12610 [Rhodospirillaceae bacterium]|nr:hypothetical protein [Rhodospirillaceae bacterium]
MRISEPELIILKREPGQSVPRYFGTMCARDEVDEILRHYIKHHGTRLADYAWANTDSDTPVTVETDATGAVRSEWFAQRRPQLRC